MLFRSQQEIAINTRGKVMIGFSCETDWLKKWGKFSGQSHEKVRQRQGNHGLFSLPN